MLTDYLDAAMHRARYEIFEEDKTYYGEIPECPGVFANEATLEECRDVLREVLEGWIIFRLRQHLEIPAVAGIDLELPVLA